MLIDGYTASLQIELMEQLIKQNNEDLQKVLAEYTLLKEENKRLKEENESLKAWKEEIYKITNEKR